MESTPKEDSEELDTSWASLARAMTLSARKAVDGLLSGAHRSQRRGASVVFVEHRDYSPGDDPRLLDWRAFARTDRDVVKRFEQETQLRASLLLDRSGSMQFQGAGAHTKYIHAATLLLAVAYVLSHQGDAVGVTVFDSQVRARVRARAHPGQIREILAAFRPVGEAHEKTNLSSALEDVGRRRAKGGGKKGILFVASDLLEGVDALRGLRSFSARGFDVRILQVLTKDELELPSRLPARFVGLEGEAAVEADPDAVRAAYRAEVGHFVDACKECALSMGASYQLVRTDTPIEASLRELLAAGGRPSRSRR